MYDPVSGYIDSIFARPPFYQDIQALNYSFLFISSWGMNQVRKKSAQVFGVILVLEYTGRLWTKIESASVHPNQEELKRYDTAGTISPLCILAQD